MIKSVIIDGLNNYKSGDVFNKDVVIIVIYLMKEFNDFVKKIYDIIWKNYDGIIFKIDKLILGIIFIYIGKELIREFNGVIKYLFNGWSLEIEVVVESKIYIVMYIEVENFFIIIFNLDGG